MDTMSPQNLFENREKYFSETWQETRNQYHDAYQTKYKRDMLILIISTVIVIQGIPMNPTTARFINQLLVFGDPNSELLIRIILDMISMPPPIVLLFYFILQFETKHRLSSRTAEHLKHEWMLYQNRKEKYSHLAGERAFVTLVEECERLIERDEYFRFISVGRRIRTLIPEPEETTVLTTVSSVKVQKQTQRVYSHDIFLSYSRSDADMMRRLTDYFRDSGLIVWTDESLQAGSPSWKDDIETALENTFCVVVLLSPDAKESRWVGEELNYAEARDVLVYPVLVRGEEVDSVPFGFTLMQRIDLRVDFQANINKLIQLIENAQQSMRYGDSEQVEQLKRDVTIPQSGTSDSLIDESQQNMTAEVSGD